VTYSVDGALGGINVLGDRRGALDHLAVLAHMEEILGEKERVHKELVVGGQIADALEGRDRRDRDPYSGFN